jgi:hypothetical protein
MEIQTRLADKLAKVYVHGSTKSVPTRKSLLLFALDVPQRIADILKIEFHSAFKKPGPLASPLPKQVAVRALARFVTVRTGHRFLLRMGRKCKYEESARH